MPSLQIQPETQTLTELAAHLRIQYEFGVDEALSSVSGDFLNPAESFDFAAFRNTQAKRDSAKMPASSASAPTRQAAIAPAATTQPAPTNKLAKPTYTGSIAQAISTARQLADEADSLEALEKAVMGFEGCALKSTASNTVFARGNPASGVMLIGEAPGAEEDRQGIPFCGPSGKLLERMLHFIGLEADHGFYITNSIFWRPPGNRQPTPEEINICKPLLEKHIALVAPKVIILLGGTATKSLLDAKEGITRLRGKKIKYKNTYISQEIPCFALFHPSYLLRQATAKRQSWQDLLAIQAVLSG
jgi:DNA polymerase